MKYEVLEAHKLAAAAVASGHGECLVEVPLWLADMVNRPTCKGRVRADLLAAACNDLLAKDRDVRSQRFKRAFAKAGEVESA